jgi:hypothetical protein
MRRSAALIVALAAWATPDENVDASMRSLYLARLMKRMATLLAVTAALCCADRAYGQSPADGARFPANATIEFLAGDDLGENHRLRIARDSLLTDVVYDRADAYEVGQWFVVPRARGMDPGTYFWQACWNELDTGAGVCSEVRTLNVTTSRAPTLTLSGAKSVVRRVLADHDASWSIWNGKRYRCRRSSRIRMLCRPTGWAGDTVMTARLQMVNRVDGWTRVRGRIEYFSEYCADVTPWRDCTDSQRVSGLY